MKKSERESKRIEAIESLKELLPAGSTAYLYLSRVSRSGMSRVIKCVTEDHRDISHTVAAATELPYVQGYNGGVRIGGCGMDMGLALIDILSRAIYGVPVDQRNDYSVRKGEKGNGGIRYIWV